MKFKKKNFLTKIFNIFYFKIIALLELIIFLPTSVILIFITRIFYRFKKIKFLPVNFSRIANIYPLYWYKRVNYFIELDNKSLKLFFIENKFKHNKTWLKVWSQKTQFLPFPTIWKNFFYLSRFLPDHKKFEVTNYDVFMHNLYLSKKNQNKILKFKDKIKSISNFKINILELNNSEILKGREYINNFGTKEFNYICFHARDPAYLKNYNKNIDWEYHNFRNSNIDNYLLAIKYLANKGHSCFRMGSKVEKKLVTDNPKIIDYASSEFQSDFLDIYLGSKCLMAVYSESGISIIPEVFNRPIVYVNWPALNFSCFNSNSLVIPKKFFSKKKNRFLFFSEILELNLESNFKTDYLKKNEIDLIENTPEEICDAVSENYDRIKGKWKNDEKAEKLQKRFWDIFNYHHIKSSTFTVGSDFLKENQEFLQ